jgi:hypothetical protein
VCNSSREHLSTASQTTAVCVCSGIVFVETGCASLGVGYWLTQNSCACLQQLGAQALAFVPCHKGDGVAVKKTSPSLGLEMQDPHETRV